MLQFSFILWHHLSIISDLKETVVCSFTRAGHLFTIDHTMPTYELLCQTCCSITNQEKKGNVKVLYKRMQLSRVSMCWAGGSYIPLSPVTSPMVDRWCHKMNEIWSIFIGWSLAGLRKLFLKIFKNLWNIFRCLNNKIWVVRNQLIFRCHLTFKYIQF